MKKNLKTYLAAWLIALAAFNAIAFLIPGDLSGRTVEGSGFWLGYIMITVSFLGVLVCSFAALKEDDLQKIFYNVPLIKISFTGLVVMAIVSILATALPFCPVWIGGILCVLVLAFTAVSVLKANIAAETVENIDNKVKAQTFFIKSLTVDADTLTASAKTEEAKAQCRKVYEAIRYSDPMSNDALAGVESQITLKFNEFSNAVAGGSDNVSALADELVVLIGDRNKKCKLLK